mmetsp:Transcript_8171/g.15114  ORF Transcript_8171/g.15114 Transcript_8171/m.15114 type:complete len:85 (-) Transcript_8171:2762-3016(-)
MTTCRKRSTDQSSSKLWISEAFISIVAHEQNFDKRWNDIKEPCSPPIVELELDVKWEPKDPERIIGVKLRFDRIDDIESVLDIG